MKERTDRIAALLERSLREELTSEEQRELEMWLSEGIENKELYQQLTDQDQLLERLRIQDKADSEAMWQKTMSRVNAGAVVVPFLVKKTKPVQSPVLKLAWIKYAAAAVVIVTVSTVAYIKMNKPAEPVAKTEQVKQVPVTPDEIVPGGKYATLTLADGSKIKLDKSPDGDLIQQSGLNLSKTTGHLTYSGRFITSGPVSTGTEKHASLHNMVSTPRGGQYQITLPDGSRVWLNAASSLRFPLAFAGNQRIVEVTGEAYFEVNKVMLPGGKEKMPFIVKIVNPGASHQVEVLGTKFNVKAYPEDKDIRTTLFEGSVRLKEKNLSKTMVPGQMAVAQDGELKIGKASDIDASAWKDGMFPIDGSLESFLNQIARWYDVEISYDNKVTAQKKAETVNGVYPMQQTYRNMLDVLESQNIHIQIEHRKLIIKP